MRDFFRAAVFFFTMPFRAAESIRLIISRRASFATAVSFFSDATTTFFAAVLIAVLALLLLSLRFSFCL
jgi:hypothetical protein